MKCRKVCWCAAVLAIGCCLSGCRSAGQVSAAESQADKAVVRQVVKTVVRHAPVMVVKAVR